MTSSEVKLSFPHIQLLRDLLACVERRYQDYFYIAVNDILSERQSYTTSDVDKKTIDACEGRSRYTLHQYPSHTSCNNPNGEEIVGVLSSGLDPPEREHAEEKQNTTVHQTKNGSRGRRSSHVRSNSQTRKDCSEQTQSKRNTIDAGAGPDHSNVTRPSSKSPSPERRNKGTETLIFRSSYHTQIKPRKERTVGTQTDDMPEDKQSSRYRFIDRKSEVRKRSRSAPGRFFSGQTDRKSPDDSSVIPKAAGECGRLACSKSKRKNKKRNKPRETPLSDFRQYDFGEPDDKESTTKGTSQTSSSRSQEKQTTSSNPTHTRKYPSTNYQDWSWGDPSEVSTVKRPKSYAEMAAIPTPTVIRNNSNIPQKVNKKHLTAPECLPVYEKKAERKENAERKKKAERMVEADNGPSKSRFKSPAVFSSKSKGMNPTGLKRQIKSFLCRRKSHTSPPLSSTTTTTPSPLQRAETIKTPVYPLSPSSQRLYNSLLKSKMSSLDPHILNVILSLEDTLEEGRHQRPNSAATKRSTPSPQATNM